MFNNIAGKIKTIATVVCWIGIIASIIGGIVLIVMGNLLVAIFVAAVGALMSWLSTVALYGFGELIEKATEIAANTAKGSNFTRIAPPVANKPLQITKPWHCDNCGSMTSRIPCAFCGHVPSKDDGKDDGKDNANENEKNA